MAEIMQTTSNITSKNRWDHILARCGIRRAQHRVQPGLYALGSPGRNSEVFITANYTLSFDALRAALQGNDAYIIVLDTKGVNVWCAAGEGTFGTEELISKIKSTGIEKIVDHRRLILPQLGATGVSAYQVKQRCGFEVEYGPVRAEDLPQYLENHHATPEMRKVRFNLSDRLTLVPVELVNSFLPMVVIAGLLYLPGGWFNVCLGFVSLAGDYYYLFCTPALDPGARVQRQRIDPGRIGCPSIYYLSIYTVWIVLCPKPDANGANGFDIDCHGIIFHPEPDRDNTHHLLDKCET